MRLIVREYLTLLKESNELDRLLPDLLIAMGLQPISRAQVGVRQDGVDVAAIGKDEKNIKTLFLFTIKRGDIGRSDWSSGTQAVRPSLDEITDVYLTGRIEKKHSKLPKKIILCTGGDLKQEAERNWDGYIKSHQIDGEIEFDFWGGDKLTFLIEEHLLNERILPNNLQSKFRRLLALVSDADYDLSDYYSILAEMTLNSNYGDTSKPATIKKIEKAFRTINLCQNIIYHWCKADNNLKPAILCSERTALNTWNFIRQHKLFDNKVINRVYAGIYKSLFDIYSDYFIKIQKHCYTPDAFGYYGSHSIQVSLNIFENLGFISIAGLLYQQRALSNEVDEGDNSVSVIADAMKNYLNNQIGISSPCYDSHIIEISAAIYFLAMCSDEEFIDGWIRSIVNHVAFAYNSMGKYFPISTDSFDDLVSLNVSETISKESLFDLSTLLPILAHWCIALDLRDTYGEIFLVTKEILPNCTLQIWYPDEETDAFIYKTNAAYNSGAMDAPLIISESMDSMIPKIIKVQERTITGDNISSIHHSLPVLPIIASRHFRTPFLPLFWQTPIVKKQTAIAENKSGIIQT